VAGLELTVARVVLVVQEVAALPQMLELQTLAVQETHLALHHHRATTAALEHQVVDKINPSAVAAVEQEPQVALEAQAIPHQEQVVLVQHHQYQAHQ
jgi:hypothetical protein